MMLRLESTSAEQARMTTTAQPEVQLARVALAVYGARLGTASMQLALDAV